MMISLSKPFLVGVLRSFSALKRSSACACAAAIALAVLQSGVVQDVFAQEGGAALDHGPRAGKVLRSGALLAEVLWHGGPKVEIYFLSPQWNDLEEPGVVVSATLAARPVSTDKSNVAKSTALTCTATPPVYTCELPKEFKAQLGDSLTVTRTKKDAKHDAVPATFEYPFTPKKPA